MPQKPPRYKQRWRYYRTSGGMCPIEKFLDDLSEADAAAVLAAMKEVQEEGTRVAHFIRNEIYEVKTGSTVSSSHRRESTSIFCWRLKAFQRKQRKFLIRKLDLQKGD